MLPCSDSMKHSFCSNAKGLEVMQEDNWLLTPSKDQAFLKVLGQKHDSNQHVLFWTLVN